MPVGPFDFLLSLPENEGRQWLGRYLLGEPTVPSVTVPFDYGRLEFLLNEVTPIRDMALPLRVGDLSGYLLRDLIATRSLHRPRPDLVKALFTLLESLPVSEPVVSLLRDLAATGAAQEWSFGDATDFHLAALRALVLHQRSTAGHVDHLIDFWTRQATDLRYASIAIQGLLRVEPREAFALIPGFVERASSTRPPVSLANLLFAVAAELGADLALWQSLAARLLQKPAVFEIVKEGFSKMRLARNHPDAWSLLEKAAAPTTSIITARDEAIVGLLRDHEVRYEPVSDLVLEPAA